MKSSRAEAEPAGITGSAGERRGVDTAEEAPPRGTQAVHASFGLTCTPGDEHCIDGASPGALALT